MQITTIGLEFRAKIQARRPQKGVLSLFGCQRPLMAHRVVSLRRNSLASIDGTADLAAHPTACL
jgi:hypothetical protein